MRSLCNYKLTFNYLSISVFPTIFSSNLVKHEVVGNYSHLFTVSGTDPELVPYMLLAHIDVVPANESDGWEVPPFSAKELNGFIYGRGTIDNKQSVMVWWAEWKAISFCWLKQYYICLYKLLLNMITSACEGDPSGSGVLVGARICSTARVLYWPGS